MDLDGPPLRINLCDVILVTPPSHSAVYQNLSTSLAALETPVWSGLLAEYLLRRNKSVVMLDAEAEGISFTEAARRIVDAHPRLAVFVVYGQQPSASTQCMPGGRDVCKKVKELCPELPTIVMGTHASALPERTLREEPYDFVCVGEGPNTIFALLQCLEAKGDVSRVPGLTYWDDGRPAFTGPAPKINDLDEQLPRQAWQLLDMSRYRAHNWHCFDHIESRRPYASVQTSLGCPYKCSFCCINAPFGGSGIRYWSPSVVIAQIDELVTNYGVTNIKIPDEMFVLSERHVTAICDALIPRGYDLNIWAYARVDTVKPRFLEKLRAAGIRWLALGIESGSKFVRDGVEKGRFGNSEIRQVVKQIQDAGIAVCGNYIFGLPDDTYESMEETFQLALGLNTEWANFYSAMAYPGSPLYSVALEKKWRLPEDWIGYSQHAYETLPLPTESLTGEQVLTFRDDAFHRYYQNPAYLAMIRARYGEPVVAHIGEMASQKSNRQFAPPRTGSEGNGRGD